MRFLFLFLLWFFASCSESNVEVWTTTPDQSFLLTKISVSPSRSENAENEIRISVSEPFQSIEGFGFTLTGGSAELMMKLKKDVRASLLSELFTLQHGGIGISYLRLSMGASDLSSRVFSYDDLPASQTDSTLEHFSLSDDTVYVIPLLKEILALAPDLRIMASPWSPPVWMKDNQSSIGGQLLKRYYSSYAKYFVRYITAMKDKGITIDAVTIQNEPQHPGNNPSMLMSAAEQADFVGMHLGPAFQEAQLSTKIIIWDHNCNRPDFPLTVLADSVARSYIHGSAFHLYAGEISALSTVHDAFPEKQIYFTEQWTGSKGTFDGDLQWHVKNVLIGSLRNWSTTVLEWNLANDPQFNPHTPGGCTECKGALAIDNSTIHRNVSYYIIAHASRFVPSGSVRVASSTIPGVHSVAFMRPDKKWVCILLNESTSSKRVSLSVAHAQHTVVLSPGAVATVVGPVISGEPK
ncbi:MAG: glycoside hydrolase family 30 protein [Bacteroidota bacterium]